MTGIKVSNYYEKSHIPLVISIAETPSPLIHTGIHEVLSRKILVLIQRYHKTTLSQETPGDCFFTSFEIVLHLPFFPKKFWKLENLYFAW